MTPFFPVCMYCTQETTNKRLSPLNNMHTFCIFWVIVAGFCFFFLIFAQLSTISNCCRIKKNTAKNIIQKLISTDLLIAYSTGNALFVSQYNRILWLFFKYIVVQLTCNAKYKCCLFVRKITAWSIPCECN